ncbi:MAG: hypothetical protein NT137_01115 [Methanomassiliicoccales archaeon]|nr:hypothetical protein [Methanomassiliicoccales archaeon]
MLIIVAVVAVVAIAGIAAVLLIGGSNTPAKPSIAVTTPANGNSYARGSALNIQWTKTGDTGSTVIIVYGHVGGPAPKSLTASAPNTGSYSWNIPSDIELGNDYFIRVTSGSNISIFGDSGSFAITAGGTSYVGTITVTSPATGSSHVRGTTLVVQWTSTGNIGPNVKVEYKRNADASWTLIVASVTNSGSYSWGMPSGIAAATDYKVKVTSTSNTSIYDDSATFTISAGGGTGLQVGQFTNYTLSATIQNTTGTYEGTGFMKMLVKSVNSTNVTYNISTSMTMSGYTNSYSYDSVANLTTGFGGIDVNNPGPGMTLTPNGTESLSTPWGNKLCQKYDYSASSWTGNYWIYNNVLMKMSMVSVYSSGGFTYTSTITYTLADTNLTSVTG